MAPASDFDASACDEGGRHVYTRHATLADWLCCLGCCPCLAFTSCAASEGAAFANPAFEQMCGSRTVSHSEEIACVKCKLGCRLILLSLVLRSWTEEVRCPVGGLTKKEAMDLTYARQEETDAQRHLRMPVPSHFTDPALLDVPPMAHMSRNEPARASVM